MGEKIFRCCIFLPAMFIVVILGLISCSGGQSSDVKFSDVELTVSKGEVVFSLTDDNKQVYTQRYQKINEAGNPYTIIKLEYCKPVVLFSLASLSDTQNAYGWHGKPTTFNLNYDGNGNPKDYSNANVNAILATRLVQFDNYFIITHWQSVEIHTYNSPSQIEYRKIDTIFSNSTMGYVCLDYWYNKY